MGCEKVLRIRESAELAIGKYFTYDTRSRQWYIDSEPPEERGNAIHLKRLPRRLSTRPDGLEIILTMSYACNLSCDYCYLDKREPAPQLARTLDLLYNQLQNADRDATILFHGGEPLQYYSSIKNFVEKCSQSNSEHAVRFRIQTNGTLVSSEVAKFLKLHHFDVCVSIDGQKKTTDLHRRLKNGAGAFENIMRGISNLKNEKVKFTALSVLTREFEESYEENLSFLRDLGAEKYQINMPIGEFAERFDFAIASRALRRLVDDEITNGHSCKENSLSLRLLQLIGLDESDACNGLPCDMGRSVISIDCYGDVYPCEVFAGDSQYLHGNIKDMNIFDYWKSPQLKSLQVEAMEKSAELCGDCPLSRFRTCNCTSNILTGNRMRYHRTVIEVTDKLVDSMRYEKGKLQNVIAVV